jgi:hypothetical protein
MTPFEAMLSILRCVVFGMWAKGYKPTRPRYQREFGHGYVWSAGRGLLVDVDGEFTTGTWP